jgi:DNA-binding MarR family transcriptional regulator
MILMTRSIVQGETEPARPAEGSATRLDPLVETLLADVQAAWCRIRTIASERLLRDGVSMAHMHLLWLLADQGPLPMTRLAESLGISLSNASGFIDRMEERGLVARVRVPDDRRIVQVRIAPEGRAAIEALELFRRDQMARVLGRLTPGQLAGVRQALADVREAYESEQEAH